MDRSDGRAETAVSVRDLVKRFPRTTALAGVSFDVSPGEVLGLLGPNGAGKTTTIHILLGLVRPTTGSVRLFGVDPHATAAMPPGRLRQPRR